MLWNHLFLKSVKLIVKRHRHICSISNGYILPLNVALPATGRSAPQCIISWNLRPNVVLPPSWLFRTLATLAATDTLRNVDIPKPSKKYHIPEEWSKSHTFLQSHPSYNKLLFHPERHPVTHAVVLDFLSITAPDAPIIDPKYEVQVSAVIAALGDLSDDDLLQVMHHWKSFPKPLISPKKEPFKQFWRAIDQDCIRRALPRRKWLADVNFYLVDLWFQLGLASSSNFHWLFVKQMLRRVDILTREQMVRFSFCLSLTKDLPESISLYDLEYNIPRIINQEPPLSSDELSILCLAFFKEKIPLHDKVLIGNILELVLRDSKDISSKNLATIVKALRLAGHKQIEDKINTFLENFVPEAERLDIHACCCLAWLGTRGGVRNTKLLEALAKRVQGNLNGIHLRNLEYLCLGLCQFNIDCQPVLLEVVEALREMYKQMDALDGQVNKCSRTLPKILNLLASKNIYPHDLISLVFSEEFLERFYGSRMFVYQPELIILDQNVLLEAKEYNGPTLSTKARGYLLKKNMMWVEPPTRVRVVPYQHLCRLVYQSLLDVFENVELIQFCNILPHHRSIEVLFCTNDSGDVIPIPESFKAKPEFEPKFLTPEDMNQQSTEIQYHVVLIYYWEDSVYNSDEPLGKGLMLRRQIENLEYKTHTITHSAWKLQTTPEEQQSYIRKILGDQVILPSPSLPSDEKQTISSKI